MRNKNISQKNRKVILTERDRISLLYAGVELDLMEVFETTLSIIYPKKDFEKMREEVTETVLSSRMNFDCGNYSEETAHLGVRKNCKAVLKALNDKFPEVLKNKVFSVNTIDLFNRICFILQNKPNLTELLEAYEL